MNRVHTVTTCVLLVVIAVVLTTLGTACSRTPTGSVDDLFISNKRFNIDTDDDGGGGIVRVYARVENTGEGVVREAKMEVVLRNSEGTKRGTNNITLENIQPGEKREFSVAVTSHSEAAEVEIIPREVEE
jgi:hypothetical protein